MDPFCEKKTIRGFTMDPFCEKKTSRDFLNEEWIPFVRKKTIRGFLIEEWISFVRKNNSWLFEWTMDPFREKKKNNSWLYSYCAFLSRALIIFLDGFLDFLIDFFFQLVHVRFDVRIDR